MKKIITILPLIAAFTLYAQPKQRSIQIPDIEQDIEFQKYDVAKEKLYKLIRSEPKPYQGIYYYNLGMIHIAQGFRDSAQIYFDKGLKAQYDKNINSYGVGRLKLDEGNEKESRSKFNNFLFGVKKDDIQPYLMISKAYLDTPKINTKKAIEYAKKAIEIAPNSVEAKVALAKAYLAYRSPKLAWATLLEAKLIDANDKLLLSEMARVHRFNSEYKDAIEYVEKVIELYPDYIPAYRQMAMLYYDYAKFLSDDTKYADFVQYYAKYHELIGKSMDMDNVFSEYLIEVKDYKTLAELTKKNWLERGDNFKIYKYSGIAHYELGDYQKAYDDMWMYFDVQDKNKLRGIDYMYFGLSQIEKEKNPDGTFNEAAYNKALAKIEQGVSQSPKLLDEIYFYAENMLKDKKYKQSYFLFDLGTKNKEAKYYAYNHYYKGLSLFLTNEKPLFKEQLLKANEALNEAIKANSNLAEAYLVNARVQMFMNNEGKLLAEKSYQDFIEKAKNKKVNTQKERETLNTQIVEACTYIGEQNMTKNPNKAKEYFKMGLEIAPNNEFFKKQLLPKTSPVKKKRK